MKYGYVYAGVSVAIVIIGGFLMYQNTSSEIQKSNYPTSCLPNDLSQVKFGFHVNLPTDIPLPYTLQGVETVYPLNTSAIFYYANHSVCITPLNYGTTAQLIVVEKNYHLTEPPVSSLEFQQANLKSPDNATYQWQAIDINSYKGLERGYYHYDENRNLIFVKEILFLNDKDQVMYDIVGNSTLNQLLSIAKSISQ